MTSWRTSWLCPYELLCTGCLECIEVKGHAFSHRELAVLLCPNCFEKSDSACRVIGDDGSDESCRWCGGDGRLVCCDSKQCTASFCETCIERNIGADALAQITADDTDEWHCFLCRPVAELETLQHELIMIHSWCVDGEVRSD